MNNKIDEKIQNHRKADTERFQIEGNITRDYIIELMQKQEKKCKICSAFLFTENWDPFCLNQFSIDRINNSKPHDIGNVMISCFHCNCPGKKTKNKFDIQKGCFIKHCSCGCMKFSQEINISRRREVLYELGNLYPTSIDLVGWSYESKSTEGEPCYLSRFTNGLDIATGDTNILNYRYAGGADEEKHIRFLKNSPYANEKLPEHTPYCICGHPIVKNCYLYHVPTKTFIVLGNCCIKKFVPKHLLDPECIKCKKVHKNNGYRYCDECFPKCSECGNKKFEKLCSNKCCQNKIVKRQCEKSRNEQCNFGIYEGKSMYDLLMNESYCAYIYDNNQSFTAADISTLNTHKKVCIKIKKVWKDVWDTRQKLQQKKQEKIRRKIEQLLKEEKQREDERYKQKKTLEEKRLKQIVSNILWKQINEKRERPRRFFNRWMDITFGPIVTFGKYTGFRMTKLLHDMDYCYWLCNNIKKDTTEKIELLARIKVKYNFS